nr:hypothetical protein [Trueperella pecoris]
MPLAYPYPRQARQTWAPSTDMDAEKEGATRPKVAPFTLTQELRRRSANTPAPPMTRTRPTTPIVITVAPVWGKVPPRGGVAPVAGWSGPVGFGVESGFGVGSAVPGAFADEVPAIQLRVKIFAGSMTLLA